MMARGTEATSPRMTSAPTVDDARVRAATGRGWDEWCAIVEAWEGDHDDHGAIASFLTEDHSLPGWWAQTVALGYERLSGRRLPGQRADGTFTAGCSRTVEEPEDRLRHRLLDPTTRAAMFPDHAVTLRSRPSSRSIRLDLGEGIVVLSLSARPDGRTTVHVEHAGLADPEAADRWRGHWTSWLDSLRNGPTPEPRGR
jgi:hypothetical protein